MVGENSRAVIKPSQHFLGKYLAMIGSSYFEIGDFERIMQLIRTTEEVKKIITHRFKITQAREAFKKFQSSDTGKVIFIPQ